jgi:hypothetical protein
LESIRRYVGACAARATAANVEGPVQRTVVFVRTEVPRLETEDVDARDGAQGAERGEKVSEDG